MTHAAYTRRHSCIVCAKGGLEVVETVMWVGALPVQIKRHLRAGEACRVEDTVWLSLRATQADTHVQVEAPPPSQVSHWLGVLRAWLSKHLHLSGGPARAH